MALTLQDLPVELLDHTLQHLPVSDLLSFARTSRANYQVSIQALTTLDLAIFPRRIHSLLAFFDAADEDDEDEDDNTEDPPISKYWTQSSTSDRSLYQVGLITNSSGRPSLSRSTAPPSTTSTRNNQTHRPSNRQTSPPPTPLSLRTAEINAQNTLATLVLSTPTLVNLRTLTLRLYDLTSPELFSILATQFPNLTNLSLEFSHPYIHDTTLPAKYWREPIPTGTPLWNTMAGLGATQSATLRLHGLRSLKLSRSGITSTQLRHWIEANPHLRSLQLSLCRGVDAEFTTWLGTYLASPVSELESVRLIDCSLLSLQSELDFDWINSALKSSPSSPSTRASLRELSLRGCKNVNDEVFVQRAQNWVRQRHNGTTCLRKVVSPKGTTVRPGRSSAPHHFVPEHDGTSMRDMNMDVNVNVNVIVSRARPGSVSPALTVSDGELGRNSMGSGCAVDRDSSLGYFGQTIAIDPAVL